MKTVEIPIKVNSSISNGLLLAGIPLAKGHMSKGSGISLTLDNERLSVWWDERAWWPDGSVKWIYLHAWVPKGTNILSLRLNDEDSKPDFQGAVSFTGNSLTVGSSKLDFNRGIWSYSSPDGGWSLKEDFTVTDLDAPAGIIYKNEVLENSPIAPLIMLKAEGDTEGLVEESLIRVDHINSRIIWTRRMNWNRSGKYRLKNAYAVFEAISQNSYGRNEDEFSLLVTEPGKVSDGGSELIGWPEGRVALSEHSLLLEKAWQRSPFGLKRSGNTVKVSFYPEEAGELGVTGGTSYRHVLHLAAGPGSNETAGYNVSFEIDPEYICNTGVLGVIKPGVGSFEKRAEARRVQFPGYEKCFKATFESGRLTRLKNSQWEDGEPALLENEEMQDKDYFGLKNYGDWPMPWGSYGTAGRRMYASNEYDPAYAYYQGYAIYSDWRYFDVACQSAIHMTDVDFISYADDMRFHDYLENGEDHEYARSQTGDSGHYWTDGYWMLYFFTGDPWAKNAALSLTQMILNKIISGGRAYMQRLWASAERHLGWPLVAAMATYEATGDTDILNKIKNIIDYIDDFTSDPDGQVENERGTPDKPVIWWRTAMQDGCKPFMLGVIMEGLERYHRESGDKTAADIIVKLAGFLTDVMWLPHQATFIYEWNAYGRGHRMSRPHEHIPLFVRGIGYAYEVSGDKKFMEISEKAFHSSLWTLYGPDAGGKSIGMIGRTLGAYVAMAEKWIEEDERRAALAIAPSSGKSFHWETGLKQLVKSGKIILTEGFPVFEDDTLVSDAKSYISARFAEPAYTDSGVIEMKVLMDKGTFSRYNQRCFIHLCDEVHTRSCISFITFYTNLHARIYDSTRNLIEVAEGYIQDKDPNGRSVLKEPTPLWEEEEWHDIRLEWKAPGEVALYMDNVLADRRSLNRRIGGRFSRISIGFKPGNWRANGKIKLIKLVLGE